MLIYPKLLIINKYSFNEYNGGGITLKNLFLDWPKDKLAIAHFSESKPMANVCEKYYKIGYIESQYIFPLNKLSTEPRGKINGPYLAKDYTNIQNNESIMDIHQHILTTNILKQKFLSLIDKTGIGEFVHPLKMSKELKAWILEYGPDIIYCQPENISFINLALKARDITKAKIVVHVMDDWPYLIYKNKTLKSVLRYIIKLRFQKLLEVSSLRLGISKAMAEEFQSRYGLSFNYFHNPIDTSYINNLLNIEKTKSDSYLIVYSGRIGVTASHDSIIEFSKCIEGLRKEGVNISFKIYTNLNNTENDFTKFQYDGTSLLPALKDDNFITNLLEADLLLYPVDFDQKSIDFIRLSFPTKLPSYLISGIPVFCYGPLEVYSIRFMKDNKLGFMCNIQKMAAIKEALMNGLTNISMRENYSKVAYLFAKNNFDVSKVRTSFQNELANC
ncbi:MAG: hypothetical protein ACOH2V_05190 [Candidatus Saccharimonadaceae bacterium]